MKEFSTFKEFYPYYLKEHSNHNSRKLHFIGTCLVLLLFCHILLTANWSRFWLIPVAGYGFAWAGHLLFEKNRPATFKHPIYSLMGDFKMFWDILRGKIKAF